MQKKTIGSKYFCFLWNITERNTESLSFKCFIMIVCLCSSQTIWWSSIMWQINGSIPKRGLSLKKLLPVTRKKPCQQYRHEYKELWNCLEPSTKGDTFVQCSPYKCAPGGRFKCKPLKVIKILTNPWWNSVAILLKLVTVLKLDRGTRRIHA